MSATKAVTQYVPNAVRLFRELSGIFLIFKPYNMHFNKMRQTIIDNLCRDLNKLKYRPQKSYVVIEGETNKELTISVRKSFADDPLIVGPRYQSSDFTFSASKIMSHEVSGIVVCGINRGNSIIHKMQEAKCIRMYKLIGVLGEATDNFFYDGKVVEKSSFAHVKRGHIDNLCSSMQSSHQKQMFDLSGVDKQSQAAYELALKGPIRPANPNIPLVYTIRCVDFSPPNFTLEVVCTQEYSMYLKTIIHDLGIQLHTNATCHKIVCIQDGLFHVEDALLTKYWTLENILSNMQMCRTVLEENPNLIEPDGAALVEYVESNRDSESTNNSV